MAISKEAEQRLYYALTDVIAKVRGGESPNTAITKIAQAERLPEGHVRLLVSAYNTGKTNKQRVGSENLFDKLASFELADPAVILGNIYPATIKTAAAVSLTETVSDTYDGPPQWKHVKLASINPQALADEAPPPAAPPDQTKFFKRAAGALERLRNDRESLYAGVENTWQKCADAFGDLQMYFRSPTSLPFEAVRANAEALHGHVATLLFDKLAESSGCCMATKPMKVDRIAKPPSALKPKPVVLKQAASHAVDREQPPYSHVVDFLDSARSHRDAFDKAAAFEKEASALELKLHRSLASETPAPLPPDLGLSLLRRLHGEKRAFIGVPVGTMASGAALGVGADAGRSILSKLSPRPDDELKEKALESLSDPSHEARLRSIRSQSALHGILNGPYFEGEDPTKVTELFNNLTRLSPRMAEQPLLLESAMRRLAAQGQADPHDLDQLLGIETKMKMRDRGPRDSVGPEGM